MTNKDIFSNPYEFFNNVDDDLKSKMELDSILVDIACKFINYRKDNNMSQKDLAKKLEISQAMVSKLESGEYNPTIEFLFNTCRKLNLDITIKLTSKSTFDVSYDLTSQENLIFGKDNEFYTISATAA